MTTPPLAERRAFALDGLNHVQHHTDHYCRTCYVTATTAIALIAGDDTLTLDYWLTEEYDQPEAHRQALENFYFEAAHQHVGILAPPTLTTAEHHPQTMSRRYRLTAPIIRHEAP